jgi:hypothetical protein
MEKNGVARTWIPALILTLPLGCGQPSDRKAPAPHQAADQGPHTDPPGAPLAAKLVVRKDTYTLDLGGKTPRQYRDAVKKSPPVVGVDLVLDLKNTGNKPIRIWRADDYGKEQRQAGGDYVRLTLNLRGPGAVSALVKLQMTTPMTPPPRALEIAPGKSYSLPITTLSYGRHGVAHFEARRACWTEAGEYTLTAAFQTAVSPAPPGSKEAKWAHFEGGLVTVTTAPVKLRVVRKGKG